MKTLFYCSLLVLIWADMAPGVQAGPLGYAITSGNSIGTINNSTGSFHFLGCAPVCAPATAGGGIGVGPGGAIDVYDVNSESLYNFNPATAGVSPIGNTGSAFSVFGGLGDGRLYGVDFNGDLYRVNGSTAATTFVSHLLDFTPDGFVATSLAGDGTNLYFGYGAAPFAIVPHDETLYLVNPNTGAIATLGPVGIETIGGSGYIGGVLYGYSFLPVDDGMGGFLLASDSIYTLNTSTGAATFLTTYDAQGLPIYGAIGTPEPGAVWVLGLGTACLAFWRRKP